MRTLLGLAALAVAIAAADTYVVVLALPDMMRGVGMSIDDLSHATPIVSAFLLGYVALLPLIGRVADLRGRVPVLLAGLAVFALGSLLTTLSPDLGTMIAGRFLQGLGGGALVPATFALVADLYPAERRGVPLGLVSGVQELGSVLGPLAGAAILALVDWRGIFAANLIVALALALAIAVATRTRPRIDPVGLLLGAVALAGLVLMLVQPPSLVRSITWGELWIPRLGESPWTTYLGLITLLALVALVLRCWYAARPLADLHSWGATLRRVDLPGGFWLALTLGGVILAFATADPEQARFAARSWWYLLGAALAAVVLTVHLRREPEPILPLAALRPRAAWGSVLVSLVIGAALVAALVDVPLFARTTVAGSSQVRAALVLVRLLVAVPVGAVAGGALIRRVPVGLVAGVGMLLAAAGFWWMSRWDADSLHHAAASVALVLAGLGFGLALAPVNAAMLAATPPAIHGLASSLVVGARMVGMLVGLSVLTTLGLHAYYRHSAALPTASSVCGSAGLCPAYTDLLRDAGIVQEHTVFTGGLVLSLAAALLTAALLGAARRRS